ncbi:hypothetical protein Htur_4240 (plasmid) [Haloterrigena turkmenica DSM 5511]|uniref:Uncharacterized protein n=1 Tax=Haloterrigena turkmenica (strain ATCC 51198 / DSM 5511 / JCM 9101 / NCIMB 13204 / VKM B-1734 / 4k) TaxID=543526 RepID=D2S112_HALTV|nr:hypothetical protein Htur_4240 [Haloterrigena turkmenica DSM 5511]
MLVSEVVCVEHVLLPDSVKLLTDETLVFLDGRCG